MVFANSSASDDMAGKAVVVEPWTIYGVRPSGRGSGHVFMQDVFGYLPRADQRRWAEAYVHGLLVTPGRKSVRRMADAIGGTPTTSQSLQQFVNASPWEWNPARQALTRRIERRAPVRAWTMASAVAPKCGERSVGVHRRFVPSAGRIVNCQLSTGLFLATDDGHLPVDWRLHLPDSWARDGELRERARIPGTERALPHWAQVLDLVDAQSARTDQAPVPVVVDAHEMAETHNLVRGLSDRKLPFLVAVPDTLTIRVGPDAGARRLPANVFNVGDYRAARLWRRSGGRPPWPAAGRRRKSPALLPLPGAVWLPDSADPCRLMVESGPAPDRPGRTWLTNVPHARTAELHPLFQGLAGQDTTMAALSTRFGLLDFEGRSFPGWHHHVTLVSAAYALSRLPRRTGRRTTAERLTHDGEIRNLSA